MDQKIKDITEILDQYKYKYKVIQYEGDDWIKIYSPVARSKVMASLVPRTGMWYFDNPEIMGRDTLDLMNAISDKHRITTPLAWMRLIIPEAVGVKRIHWREGYDPLYSIEAKLISSNRPFKYDFERALAFKIFPEKGIVEIHNYEGGKMIFEEEVLSVNESDNVRIAEIAIILMQRLQRRGFKLKNGDINMWMDWEDKLDEFR